MTGDAPPAEIPLSLKEQLADETGRQYRDFRRELRPRYARIWFDIGLGFGALGGIVALLAWLDAALPWAIAAVVLGALLVGYTLAYLNNFFHEAAHHNLLPSRRANDIATNVAMAWLFGSSIQQYRKIHFQHHRALGTTADSENSYFDPLRLRYMAEGLLGLKVVRTLQRYRQMEQERPTSDSGGAGRLGWSLLAAVANLSIAAALWLAGAETAGVAWIAGLLLAFPFFVSLRQLLEHRSEHADPAVDYTNIDHGAVNRLFGDGPVANTIGSAGFNRHALHHWEPNLSYTRLPDLERWLLRTDAAPLVVSRQTTYTHTFLRLLEL